MSENRINSRRIRNYREYIKNILSNRDIDCDETWWDSDQALAVLDRLVCAKTWEISDSGEMGIDSSENFLFVKYTGDSKTGNLLKEIEKSGCSLAAKPESADKNLHIICIVDTMKNRVFLEKRFLSAEGKLMKKNLRKAMKAWKGTVNFLYILDNSYGEQDIKLSSVNRFDFIQMPPMQNHINWEDVKKQEEVTTNRGYVTSVQLAQLVEIYNKIGDKLFKRNVRYGLNEQLGVDRAIKDTLKNRPQDFWFKNNGITILVERPDFKLDRVEEVLLEHITEYGDLHFSVINGAQTITASAQCLYEMGYELEELEKIDPKQDEKEPEERIRKDKEARELKRKIEKSRDAKVLLRIIHIPYSPKAAAGTSDNSASKEVNEISVALNRQKPIKAEDIAFASPFVEKLAAFLEREQMNGKMYFRLVKRGEGSITNRAVDLADFARARKAYAGYPGDARSKGTNVLLSSKNGSGGEFTFQDKSIFVPEWLDAEEEQEAAVFEKYYGAVYFAVKVADFYGAHFKKIAVSDPGELTVLQNGKWYFTAYLVQLFNGFRDDYSRFIDCFEMIRDKLEDLMKLFAKQCHAAAVKSGNFKSLDSNTFKGTDLFLLTRQEASADEFARTVNNGLEDDEKFEFVNYQEAVAASRNEQEKQSSRSDSSSESSLGSLPDRPVSGKAKFIKLNGAPNERVSSTAHAMVKTVQFILANTNAHEEDLLACGFDWFTDDPARMKEGYGYLRQSVEITAPNGKTYWVGTHSNSRIKYKQITDFCETAWIKKHSIYWFAVDGVTPLFSW